MARQRLFASDNASGACPEVMQALIDANHDHAMAYGDDPITERAVAAIRKLFGGRECAVFFTFTGTAANALALAALCPPYGRVACTAAAHVAGNECGAPGLLGGGLQLNVLPDDQGRLDPTAVERWAASGSVHVGLPCAVTVTQSTELGTVYRLDHLRAIAAIAKRHRLRIHLDGSRLANALATLGCSPGEMAEAVGADVVVLGGTKNGLLGCEAMVVFDPKIAETLPFRRKQAGQLASKHRFLAAQWLGVLESGAWMRNAIHANAMAARLASGLEKRGIALARARETNELFAVLSPATATALNARGWTLHTRESWGGHRLVCSWDTTERDIAELFADLDSAK